MKKDIRGKPLKKSFKEEIDSLKSSLQVHRFILLLVAANLLIDVLAPIIERGVL